IEEANATATADTIELKKGCTYNVTSVLPGTEGGLPTIVAPLTIHGNGATTARDPSAPPLQLIHVRGWTEPEGFVVDDLTVRGGAAPKGGAILVTPWFGPDGPIASAPSVAVSDSTFVDNRTVAIDAFDQGGVGGAIAVEGWPGGERSPVTLVNDTFTDNATHDGPLYDDPNQCPQCSWDTRSGGAVSIGGAGVTTIAGCTFTSNRTGDGPANDGWPWTGWYSHGGAVYVNNGSATVSDSVFTGNATGSGGSGQNGGGGGAIAVEGGSLTVTGSTFTGNATGSGGDASAQAGEGGRGGAVSLDNRGTPSFLRVVDSTFTGNATGDGGVGATRAGAGPGGALWTSGRTTVTGSTFSLNETGIGSSEGGRGSGGGIAAVDSLTVTDCTFDRNDASSSGGGIFAAARPEAPKLVTVTGSTFTGNGAGMGGGAIGVCFETAEIVNSTFTGNDGGTGPGGGVFFYVSTAYVTNSTLAQNAAGNGGGFYGGPATISMANTILAGNTAVSGPSNCGIAPDATFSDRGGNLSVDGGGCPATFATGDPKLQPLADYGGPTQTMALGAGGAAIDAADDGICAAPLGPPDYGAGAVDQRGVARPQGSHCDIGAYERVP